MQQRAAPSVWFGGFALKLGTKVLAVVLIALVAGTYLVWRQGQPSPPPSLSGADVAAASEALRESSMAADLADQGTRVPRTPAPVAEREAPQRDDPVGQRLVRVSVSGLVPSELEQCVVSVASGVAGLTDEDREWIEGTPLARGRLVLSIDALFDDDEPDELLVRVDHPMHAPFEDRLRVETDFVVEDERRVYDVTAKLSDAAIVIGQVLGAAEGGVAAFASAGGGLARQPADAVPFRAGSTYRLRLPKAGRYEVVAGALHFTPASRPIDVVLGDVTTVEDLVLRAGAAIRGETRLDGAPIGACSVTLKYEHAPDVSRHLILVSGFTQGLVWLGERFVNDSFYTVSDGEGRFEVVGLEPGRYRTWARRESAFSWMRDDHSVVLQAPDDRAIVELALSLLILDVPAELDAGAEGTFSLQIEGMVRHKGRFRGGRPSCVSQFPPKRTRC